MSDLATKMSRSTHPHSTLRGSTGCRALRTERVILSLSVRIGGPRYLANRLSGRQCRASCFEEFAGRAVDKQSTTTVVPRTLSLHGNTDVVARARAYVFAPGFPDSVAGDGGHDTLFRVACELIDGFGLSHDQAWPIFVDWNARRAHPPESDAQLSHKRDDAIRKHSAPSKRRLRERQTKQFSAKLASALDEGPLDNGLLDEASAELPRTDIGNAERMTLRHGINMRYCHPWKKWLRACAQIRFTNLACGRLLACFAG